ncbi:MAG: class I SAM-dependent methyltransferase [Candidatus Omnitrophica bacterium]|nr:class I SAM-dependent methyltransferase [Candidatus Omnitrophota bacterium]
MTRKNEGIYTGFAQGYDLVMRDVDFEQWAQHILRLRDRHGLEGNRILNLACGTGVIQPTWIEHGFEVVGIDQSEEMIVEARRKNSDLDGVVFEVGDMREFDLGEKYDLITCLYDSLNYLTDAADVRKFFRRVKAHLAPDGGFIFDVATEANILDNFTETTYAENLEEFAYIWENSYNLRTKICQSDFAFFRLDPNTGQFVRRIETHFQKMYSSRDLNQWLGKCGLKTLASYDGVTLNPPHSRSDRIHFVAGLQP